MDSKQTRNVNKMQNQNPGRVIYGGYGSVRSWAQQVNNSRGRNPAVAQNHATIAAAGPHFQADTAASEVMSGSGEFVGADQSFARND